MIALARFLGPAEFGIFAMTMFVNELAQLLVDFGIGSALVQRKEISQRILASCFWINIGVASVAAVVLIGASPFIAGYFVQPLVQGLLIVTAVNVLVSSATVLPQSLLVRRLAFRDITIATTIGSLCGAGAALAMAVSGMGVWSLAFQPLIGTTVAAGLMFKMSGWRPSFELDLAGIRGILKFSSHLLFSNVLSHVSRNLTSLILGPALGAAALGKITMAQTITWLPVAQVSQTIVRATFPVFAQLQDEMDRFREGFYKATAMIALFAFPLMTGIGVLAGDLVPVVFGPKWQEVGTLVAIVCVPALLQCVTTLAATALLGVGRSDLLLKLSVLALPVVAVPLWLAREASLQTVVIVLAATTVATSVIALIAAMRAIGGSWRRYCGATLPPAAGSLCMGVILWFLTETLVDAHAVARLVGLSVVGTVAYVLLAWLINREMVLEAYRLVRGLVVR